MKSLLALLTTGLFVLVAQCQPGPVNLSPTKLYTLTDLGMRGRVKSVTEKTFQANSSGYDEGSTEISQFDAAGKLTEKKTLLMFAGTAMGTVIEKYNYNAKDKLVKIMVGDDKGKFDESFNFIYDSKGNLTEMSYTAPTTGTKEKYEYDDKGNLVVKKMYDATKKLSRVIRYTYDGLKRFTVAETEETDKKEKYRVRYTYNENYMQPKMSNIETDGKPAGSDPTGNLYFYNSSGDVSGTGNFNAAGRMELYDQTFIYIYDKAGNWTKVTHTGYGGGYTTRALEYYPPEEKPETKYKNAIMEFTEPPIVAFGKLMQSAIGQNTVPSMLLNDQKAMIPLAQNNLTKLKAIPDLPGNTSKQAAQKLLEYIIAPATSKQVQNIIKKEGNYTSDMNDIGTKMKNMRNELGTELKKLP